MSNFRKLKEYSNLGTDNITILDLMRRDCEYWYDGKTYKPSGLYYGQYDFLLEYYVKGIMPQYKIENDKIIPYLHITLSKNGE